MRGGTPAISLLPNRQHQVEIKAEKDSRTCFLSELQDSGQHRGVPGLKEIDDEQGQGVVAEQGATPWVNENSS